MLSNVGQQRLQGLVSSQGRAAVEQLVANKDVGALEKAGLSKIDALALVQVAQEKGFDAVFGSHQAFQKIGGPAGQSANAQQAVSDFAGQKRAGGLNGGLNAVFAVRGGLLDGVPPEKIKAFNLQGVARAHDIKPIAEKAFEGRAVRAQFSGYSAPPAGTKYAENTAAFVSAFADKVGAGTIGMITSPTADRGSIDAITTMTGQGKGIPVLSITAKDYVGYIDPSKFPPEMDKAAYTAAPKYVFNDGDKYSQATALASNAFVATGGRDVTISDFLHALEEGNPVVLVVDQSVSKALGDKAIWDADKGRVNNGAAYLAAQFESMEKTGKLAHPEVDKGGRFGSLDAFAVQNLGEKFRQLVKVVTIDAEGSPESIARAAADAAAHVNAFRGADMLQTKAAFGPASVGEIKGAFKDNYLAHATDYAARSAQQFGASIESVPDHAKLAKLAQQGLEDVVKKTAQHFATGKLTGLDDPAMNAAAVRQHAGYVSGELARKFGISADTAASLLVPFYEKTMQGADKSARQELAEQLGAARGYTGDRAALKAFVADDNNGWMFNQWGFGDVDKALNRPGVYAAGAVQAFAEAITGDPKRARVLLSQALNHPPRYLASLLDKPMTLEGAVAQFAARAAQAGWLVSKTGQGLVEAHHQDPARAERGLNRFAPRNDLITDFDSLSTRKGWAEVAKDLDQVKTALQL